MLERLKENAQALRLALIDGDSSAVEQHQRWLMGEIAAGLLHQDSDHLLDLRAAIADLAPVADRYGPGKRGDRWRTAWELLYAISQTVRPLEQQRLARADTLAGQILRRIVEQPGITPGEIVAATGKARNHVSNELALLQNQGLVYRVPRGRSVMVFPTPDAAARFPDLGQMAAAPQVQTLGEQPAVNDASFPYVNENRLAINGGARGKGYWQGNAAGARK